MLETEFDSTRQYLEVELRRAQEELEKVTEKLRRSVPSLLIRQQKKVACIILGKCQGEMTKVDACSLPFQEASQKNADIKWLILRLTFCS